MAIIIHWVKQQNTIDHFIEIPLLEAKFIIYYAGDVITKTEWHLERVNSLLEGNHPLQSVQRYINNPLEELTVCLKQQGSDYRHKVWAQMCKIPVGQTLTYSELASQIGSGARAVANACRDNPFPGIIPCHRVVAVSGLGGYMGQTNGGALEIKRKLLAKEAELINHLKRKA